MRHVRFISWLLAHAGAAFLVTVLVVTAGSAEPPSRPVGKATKDSPAAGGEVALDAPLATFHGGAIRVRDWLEAYGVKLPQQQRALALPEGRVQLLRDLERYALLVQEAERRGYGKDVVVEGARDKTAIDALIAKELTVAPEAIGDAEVAAEYDHKRAQFNRPALRRASQIVVANEADAKSLLRELRGATRERFGTVARERSSDEPTRRQSGELGWFTREGRGVDGRPVGFAGPLVEAAWALPRVGALSHPVRVPGGFAVLILTGEDVALEHPLSEVAGELREQLAARKSAERLEQRVAELRASTKIELHPERMDAIVLDTERGRDIPQGFPAYPEDPRIGPKRIKPDKY